MMEPCTALLWLFFADAPGIVRADFERFPRYAVQASLLQDVAKEGGPGALALLREADASCLHLTCLRLDLVLSLHAAIDVWTASVTHKPYTLHPDFDL